ncbi:hypothetical protein GCM10009550_53510 [Actinocorallia libanotica]|uniref:Uncharacterized protein n=1 Tax=Actinocorallia libanotica TaxID=46162 RepID=A0ABN1RPY0_9ACTN
MEPSPTVLRAWHAPDACSLVDAEFREDLLGQPQEPERPVYSGCGYSRRDVNRKLDVSVREGLWKAQKHDLESTTEAARQMYSEAISVRSMPCSPLRFQGVDEACWSKAYEGLISIELRKADVIVSVAYTNGEYRGVKDSVLEKAAQRIGRHIAERM